jgi:hypothetical protein
MALRWRFFLFQWFFWPFGAALASADGAQIAQSNPATRNDPVIPA